MRPRTRTRIRYAACFFLLVFTKSGAAGDSPFIASYAESIQSFLNEKFADGDAGMVIGLVDEHESRVFSAGKLDNGTDRAIDGDTVFPIGSVTKVFTSLLALDAERLGEVDLDGPVTEHLPSDIRVPGHGGKSITLRNLAVQDSGLPFHAQNMADSTDPETGKLDLRKFKAASEAITAQDLYAAVSQFELKQTPGEAFQYSNVGMALLGNAIETRTGRSYESLIVDRICQPLEMKDTCITLSAEQKSRRVAGHLEDGSRVGHWNFQAMAPACGVFSTTNDLLKFLAAQLRLRETLLATSMKESHANRHTDVPQFGMTATPWYDSGVYNPPGTELLGHAGHGFGGRAIVVFDAKNRRGVVVLTNQLKVYPNGIGWTLMQGMPFSPQNLAYAVREVEG
jgi:serine-type D-Ala-D-Ala carboxypeptidase/endopeptidase